MKNSRVKLLTYSALFCAAIYVMTMISIPLAYGYIHVGDTLIMLCASLLPSGYAVIAAALGGALADLTLGYITYIPFTFIIKALIAFCFSSKHEKIICKHNLLSFIAVAVITPAGYYLAECLIYSSFVSPVASLPFNILQAAASIILYFVVGTALDAFNIKQYLHFNKK